MNDSTHNAGAGAAIVALSAILLLLAAGGGLFWHLRQEARLRQEVARAQAESLQARQWLEQATLRQNSGKSAQENESQETDQARREPASQTQTDSPATNNSSLSAAVMAVLQAQQSAWNAGDLDGFMSHYWKSDDLTFSSGGQTTRGWSATLQRYQQRYPTAEKMGRVRFDELEITPLGADAALVLGRWHVDRESEPLTGNFSIVLRRVDGRWVIIHDHTSRKSD